MLYLFVMTNAVTAIFVASTDEYAGKDAQLMVYEQLTQKSMYMKQIFSVYSDMDQDGDGCISKSEFEERLDDPRMIDFARSLEINLVDLEQFFDILSCWGQRPVDLDTFVDGCIKLRGAARSMDIYELLMRQHSMEKDVSNIRSLILELGHHNQKHCRQSAGPKT